MTDPKPNPNPNPDQVDDAATSLRCEDFTMAPGDVRYMPLTLTLTLPLPLTSALTLTLILTLTLTLTQPFPLTTDPNQVLYMPKGVVHHAQTVDTGDP